MQYTGDMNKVLSRQSGFTAVELVIAVIVAVFISSLFMVQRNDTRARGEDNLAKANANAIHYYLEDIYYAAKKGYPEKLSADTLKGLDPNSLKDVNGKQINDKDSLYHYQPADCTNGICEGYRLTVDLEKEADYVKTNRAH